MLYLKYRSVEKTMNNIGILHANESHKDFLIYANKVIDQVNDMNETNGLQLNIDKDYFCDNPKFQCLVAEVDNKPVGMILYSYFYWASDGQVLWISQMYIEPEFRKQGIFFKLISKLREENKDIKIVSCATGEGNERMQKILKYYGGVEMKNLKFYYKKI